MQTHLFKLLKALTLTSCGNREIQIYEVNIY